MSREKLLQDFSTNFDALRRVGMMRHSQEAAHKHLPSHAQMGVLFTIAHRGAQTTKELSQLFGLTSSAVTQLVNGLVKDGLLERKGDARDGRKANIQLTKKGKNVLVKSKQLRIKRMQEVLAPLSDKELAQLVKIQTKIVEQWNIVCQKPQSK